MSKMMAQGIFFLLLVPFGWFLAPGVVRRQALSAGKIDSPDWIRRGVAVSRCGVVAFLVIGVVSLVKAFSGA